MSAGHKVPIGLPRNDEGLRPGNAEGLRPGDKRDEGLRPGTQDDMRETESTGHRNPVIRSTIAVAKAATSARNSFSSLRTLDTEGTADAGEWRPGAGCCVSNALLLRQDRRPIPRRDACLDQKFQELLVVEKEDQSAT